MHGHTIVQRGNQHAFSLSNRDAIGINSLGLGSGMGKNGEEDVSNLATTLNRQGSERHEWCFLGKA
jgi:hypothetical protein